MQKVPYELLWGQGEREPKIEVPLGLHHGQGGEFLIDQEPVDNVPYIGVRVVVDPFGREELSTGKFL